MHQAPTPMTPAAGTSWFAGRLECDRVGPDVFRGDCHSGAPGRVMGGQIAAQAVVAAGRTVAAGQSIHSVHSYFLRGGDPSTPIEYRVDRLRDGRTYATRTVTAVQGGEPLFALTASFKSDEPGLDRQRTMPEAPEPEELPDAFLQWGEQEPEVLSAAPYVRAASIRVVPTEPAHGADHAPGETRRSVWLRTYDPLPADRLTHAAALTYVTDLTIAQTSIADRQERLFPFHPKPARYLLASLDHCLWFHRPFRADEWLLFAQHSVSTSDGRGFSTGDLWSRDGALVASVTQESVMRSVPPTPAGPAAGSDRE